MRREPLPATAPAFGIAAGAAFLPPQRRTLDDWAARVGAPARGLLPSMKANGLSNYHVAPDMSIEDLCAAAVERLLDALPAGAAGAIDLVLYCHTNATSVMAPPASLPSTLIGRFGMRRATGHSISQQNCASIVCALRLLRTILWRRPWVNDVLIVSGDKVFGETSRNVSDYAIQSDGALALLIRRDAPRNRVGHISYNIDGRYYRGSAKGPELAKRYGLNYAFSAHRAIAQVIDRSGWTAADVDAVLPMNANLTAFSKVIELLGVPMDRLHSRNIGATGHIFCCDPFLNFLDRFRDPSQIRSGNAILFASASSGVFCALGVSDAWTGALDAAPKRVAPLPADSATLSTQLGA
ncbi:MAG: 3-oxoacyl-[acyl-carrier-protein] synthase III C-terminal domain-containing protein [Burkholderiaceae bacterium]